MFEYFFEIVSSVMRAWAVKHPDMTDEEFDEWCSDYDRLSKEMSEANTYRCTNGRVFRVLVAGIMKSGLLTTIPWNTLSQLALDVLIKIRLGLSDDDMLDEVNAIIAGGDDVLQTFSSNVDLKRYINEAKLLGVLS